MSEEELKTEEPTSPPVTEEVIDYKDKYLRLLADVENMRKRMHKEKQENTRFALDNILTEILGPIDNFENALQFAHQMSEEVKNWAIGFQMILAQFKEIMTQNGAVSFVSEGQPFDSVKHEAVETEETDTVPEGIIVKEFVKGYRCGDRIIRPARVKVAKNKKEEEKTK